MIFRFERIIVDVNNPEKIKILGRNGIKTIKVLLDPSTIIVPPVTTMERMRN